MTQYRNFVIDQLNLMDNLPNAGFHQDQEADYPQSRHGLDHLNLFVSGPFKTVTYPWNPKTFDSDQEIECDKNAVNSPKQLALDFKMDYRLPVFVLENGKDRHEQKVQETGRNEDINDLYQADQKLFNTMPALTLTAIQSFADELSFDGTQYKIKFMSKVQQVFELLIKNVLKGLKHEDKNKTQLRLLLDDIDSDLNDKIQEKIVLSLAQEEYFKILELKDYNEEIVNAAKESLREAISNYMNNDWIFNHAINKKFKRDEKLKQIVLEKYLKNFRMELKKEGKVSIFVDRKKVLDIYSRVQEA